MNVQQSILNVFLILSYSPIVSRNGLQSSGPSTIKMLCIQYLAKRLGGWGGGVNFWLSLAVKNPIKIFLVNPEKKEVYFRNENKNLFKPNQKIVSNPDNNTFHDIEKQFKKIVIADKTSQYKPISQIKNAATQKFNKSTLIFYLECCLCVQVFFTQSLDRFSLNLTCR